MGARPSEDGEDHGEAPSAIRNDHGRRGVDILGDERRLPARARMKVSLPASAFLSWPMCIGPGRRRRTDARGRRSAIEARGQAGGGDGRLGSAGRPGGVRRAPGRAEKRKAMAPCPPPRPSPCSRAVAVAGLGFQGVAEGVAQVQQRAAALLLLVLGDDLGLHFHRTADGVDQGGVAAPAPPGRSASSHSKKAEVAQQAVLDHLGIAAAPSRGRAGWPAPSRSASTSRG